MYQIDANKILAKYVQQALLKKSGESTGAISNALPGSKMVVSPHYTHMDDEEIEDDIGEFNRVWRAPRGKSQVSPLAVKELALKIQANFLSAEAKRHEAEFKQREEKARRKKNMVNRAVVLKKDLMAKVENRRQLETAALDSRQGINGLAGDKPNKVKDMDIG